MVTRDKIRGMFLGIAGGDALGKPLETGTKEENAKKFGRVTSFIRPDGHKWYNGHDAGTWTDDTQLSLAVAESLIANGKMDMDDLAARHVALLPTAKQFGWGRSTRKSVTRLSQGMHWSKSGKSSEPNQGMGNGVAMKVAPVGAWIAASKTGIDMNVINDFTRMTHATGMAETSAYAQIFAVEQCLWAEPQSFKPYVVSGILHSVSRNFEIIDPSPDTNDRLHLRLCELHNMVCTGEILTLTDDQIIALYGGGTCYVYNSLPFAHAFFLRKPTSIEALYDVVNVGGDTDSNGSMVGALLGALNGASIFPKHLIDGLWRKDEILDVAERFCDKFGVA